MDLIQEDLKIGGNRVIARRKVEESDGKDVFVVCVDRGEKQRLHRYVTARWKDGDAEWYWGSYHDTLILAAKDYDGRT